MSERSQLEAANPRTGRSPVRRPLTRAGLAVAALVAIAGCAQDAPQDSWAPAGENAQKIHDLQWPIFLVAGIVGVIVFAFVLICVIKFKDRGQPIPEQTHGKAWLEYLFIAIPAVMLAVIGGFTVNTVFALAETDDTECRINVTGNQWWWEFRYDLGGAGTEESDRTYDDIVTANDMVIPADTDISLKMTARDVIHGWWVPTLNGKRDGFVLDDFKACSKAASMKRGRAEAIIGEVREVVGRWRDYADEAGVLPEHRDRIQQTLRLAPFA